VYPHRRRLKRRNAARFCRRLRAALADAHVDDDRLVARVRGWMAHASHGNTIGLQKSILANHGLAWATLARDGTLCRQLLG